MLQDIAVFLAAAVIAVPLSRRLGLGAVLGYVGAGLVIGPWGLGLITDVERILHFSEFGIVLLLFVVGLELQPVRLWRLRGEVFGLGGLQVLLTSIAFAGLLVGVLAQSWPVALLVGFGLAMSSTALVLQILSEREEMGTHHGRASFAVLLFQDLAVILFLAAVPALAGRAQGFAPAALHAAQLIAMVAILAVIGRFLLRPFLRAVASARITEVFTAATLLVVIGTALAMQAIGFSASLGAFLAGVLLSDSEYRHELQAHIEPFKGLLLGLFFIAVGMSANLGLAAASPLLIITGVAAVVLVKALLLYGLAQLWRMKGDSARAFALVNSQAGEFTLVLFAFAAGAGLLATPLHQTLVLVVILSMAATPLLYVLQASLRRGQAAPPYDEIQVPETPVLIVGFGPFAQIIGRILQMKRIPFTVLEKDVHQVDFMRRFGNPVFYSDAARVEVLRAAHADKARACIIATAQVEESVRVATTLRRHFPQVQIFAAARTRQHALALMDVGVRHVIRRSFYSSLEMTRQLLLALGNTAEEAAHIITTFQRHDEATLLKQQAVYRDEHLLRETAETSTRELEELFEADRAS